MFIIAIGQIRPKRDSIKQEQFESLCAIQCTEEEILSVLDVSKDTLLRWCKETYKTDFATIYAEKKKLGKASLRRMQWKTAEKGNVTMQIWLGKNLLGQKENLDIDTKVQRVEILNDLPKEDIDES